MSSVDSVDNVSSVDSVDVDTVVAADSVDTVYFVDAEDSVESVDSVYTLNSEMLQEAGRMNKSIPFKNFIGVSPVALELR
jgi:hypothetical protein